MADAATIGQGRRVIFRQGTVLKAFVLVILIALIVLSALTACVLVGAIVIVKRNVSKYKKIANLYEENRTRMYTEVR